MCVRVLAAVGGGSEAFVGIRLADWHEVPNIASAALFFLFFFSFLFFVQASQSASDPDAYRVFRLAGARRRRRRCSNSVRMFHFASITTHDTPLVVIAAQFAALRRL